LKRVVFALFIFISHSHRATGLTLLGPRVFEKNPENAFSPPKMVESKKLMVPSESALQELSNEWSCQ
jgi:hypothetical protein